MLRLPSRQVSSLARTLEIVGQPWTLKYSPSGLAVGDCAVTFPGWSLRAGGGQPGP